MLSDRPALLFYGALYHDEAIYQQALQRLTQTHGAAMLETPPADWSHSSYYRDELGGDIKRRFIFFERLIDQSDLLEIKRSAMALEDALSLDGNRRVNLDPGYLTEAKVVLSTKKDYGHRLCIGKGIFAEVTLRYAKDTFVPHIFTYDEYASPDNVAMFLTMREGLRAMLGRKGK